MLKTLFYCQRRWNFSDCPISFIIILVDPTLRKTDGKISCTTQTLERQTSESPACPHKDEEHIPFALNSGKSTPKYPSRHYRVASYRALRPPPIF